MNNIRVSDLVGFRSGEIEVLRKVRADRGTTVWECKCHRCGGTFQISERILFNYYLEKPEDEDRSMKYCLDCIDELGIARKSKRPRTYSSDSWSSTCSFCGKRFGTLSYIMGEYAYRRYPNKIFCSYGCMRKYDRELEAKNGKSVIVTKGD